MDLRCAPGKVLSSRRIPIVPDKGSHLAYRDCAGTSVDTVDPKSL